ncbi:MAG: DUF922 domain-containing protein [Pirellulales bacterium]
MVAFCVRPQPPHGFLGAARSPRSALCRLLVGLFACSFTALAPGAEDNPLDEPVQRKYQEGPLSAKDYLAPVPKPVPAVEGAAMHASTATRVSYTYDAAWNKTQGRFVMTLKKIEFLAVIERNRSWNMLPGDRLLLDHEQGHFDLAEIAARQAQARFDKARAAHQELVGKGTSKAAAQKDLEQKIQREFQAICEAEREEEKRYDRVTRHGADWTAQAQERRKQRSLLRPDENRAKDRSDLRAVPGWSTRS